MNQHETQAVETQDPDIFELGQYRIKEISKRLSMGVSTLYLYQSKGLFPLGNKLSTRLTLYSSHELNTWVNEVLPQLNFISKQPEADRTRLYN